MQACFSPNPSIPSQIGVTDEMFLRQLCFECMLYNQTKRNQADSHTEDNLHYTECNQRKTVLGHAGTRGHLILWSFCTVKKAFSDQFPNAQELNEIRVYSNRTCLIVVFSMVCSEQWGANGPPAVTTRSCATASSPLDKSPFDSSKSIECK